MIAIILVIWTFHFPEEETVAKSKFDTKGLTLFYVFIGLIMFVFIKPTAITFKFLEFYLSYRCGNVFI